MAADLSQQMQFHRSDLVMMQNRRALGEIDFNVIEARPFPFAAVDRRVMSGENALHDQQHLRPESRPVQRKFPVPIAADRPKLLLPEETKKKAPVLPDHNESVDSPVIDLEDHNAIPGDFSAPAFIQHTEAILDEIDQMDEIEMEDACKDPILDIDICDKKDPLAVTEYIDDLYQYYKKVEGSGCVLPNYMDHHFDINKRMRAILIDWLIEVHYKFQLMDETLYLTVNLVDRFLSLHPIVRKKLQLVGVTAMLLASKYEEVSVFAVEDLILITDRAYNRKEVLDMERLMVNTLQFNMSIPTPYVFMWRFLKAAQSDKKLELVAFFMMELCLVEYEMLRFPPSLLAASAIYTAQCTVSRLMSWSKTCEYYTGYREELLLECSKRMVTFHQNAGWGQLTGVYRKYSMSKFGYAAKAEPASFLLNASL